MKISFNTFLRSLQQTGKGDERFQSFDPERFDYTAVVEEQDGRIITLRNPGVNDGSCYDKAYTIDDKATLLKFGSAFWDWCNQTQQIVGIDIDHETGHAEGVGISQSAFDEVDAHLKKLPWVEVRRSTGGLGRHVLVQFDQPVDIKSRAESTALANAALTVMSRQTGFDFKSVKDCAGGNLWIYSSKAADNAFQVMNPATGAIAVSDLPPGWREAKAASSHMVSYSPSTIELSDEHLRIEKQIAGEGGSIIYVPDKGCYHIHTKAIEKAFQKHNYRGHFSTVSDGTDLGKPNSFMFPLEDGGFLVKRFGNAKESASWYDSANGSYAYLNVNVPVKKALHQFATNNTGKGHEFSSTNLNIFLQAIGCEIRMPQQFSSRLAVVRILKEEELQLSIKKHTDDPPQIDGWSSNRADLWQKSFLPPAPSVALTTANYIRATDLVRAVTTETESAKWCVRTDGEWIGTNVTEVRNVLTSQGLNATVVMGQLRQKPYHLVYEPFQSEYLSNRRWNFDAPQLRYQPADEAQDTPTWDAIFDHLGSGLDQDIYDCLECKKLGIASGSHYLKLWVKLLIEKPSQRLPYLFFASKENNTGKSSFGSSIQHMIHPGVGEINEEAITEKFNSELENKILCLVEEVNLSDKKNKAYSTIKRLVTSPTITVRKMRTDAYNVPNLTHFIHTANDARFVPVDDADMRVVIIPVRPLKECIDSVEFEAGVKKEATSILRKLIDLALPPASGRLWLPVIQTSLKEDVIANDYGNHVSEAEVGIKQFSDKCLEQNGEGFVSIGDCYELYKSFCKSEHLSSDVTYPVITKAGFIKALRKQTGWEIGKTQRRINQEPKSCYTGFVLSA
jgi:hypothetical protein